MINQINLEYFKCFKKLQLPLSNFTLLAGANASGKSTVLQAMVLLHQSIQENEWASRLMLNGSMLKMGTVSDVVNKVYGRHSLRIEMVEDSHSYTWSFSGERDEMSLAIDSIQIDDKAFEKPIGINKLLPTDFTGLSNISDLLEDITYITAERVGPREFYKLEDRAKKNSVGSLGENTASILHNCRDEKIDERLVIDSVPPTLLRQVEARMGQFFPGCGLVVDPIPRMNAVTLGIRTSEATDYHRPIHVGFGLTQILPIIVATLSAMPDDLLLIENPEVHLHPAAQMLMGYYLARVASTGVQVIVETHSDHVLNGLRRAVKNKILPFDKASLYFFQTASENLDPVVSPRIDQNGNIDFWPNGFFDQFDKDMNHFAGWGD